MNKLIPTVNLVQRTLSDQFEASRSIFEVVEDLARIAKAEKNPDLQKDLESIMRKLLEIGEDLSSNANRTGEDILNYIREPKQ